MNNYASQENSLHRIKYMTDNALKYYNENFETIFLPWYKSGNKEALKDFFSTSENVFETDIYFDYQPLEVEIGYNKDIALKNVKILWQSLQDLPAYLAEKEKIWIALLHTDYLDFLLDTLQGEWKAEKSSNKKIDFTARVMFKHYNKRSLFINLLALPWWLANCFRDDSNEENPYELLEFFLSTSYRGNAVVLSSSNILFNKNIALGILDGVRDLSRRGIIKVDRYAYSDSTKLLNEIGGVRMLDLLTREEIKEIIINDLPNFGK